MHLSDFKAGRTIRQDGYDAFIPAFVNQECTWGDARINTLLEDANRALGELNAFSLIVPHIDVFTRLHVVKEAADSSRIEGTRTGIDEALRPREEIEPERRDDWVEVQNYIEAMNQAISRLSDLPLSNRLLRETHRTLMKGVRGQHKMPGAWRRSQNWIGGTSPGDAVFVPPPHHEVPALMSDLEKFWHNESIDVPHLIRISISHYQFETIHPFLDGNGRVGRLLITLYLIGHGLLKKPSLYLSSHIERNKMAYYRALSTVRASDDLGQWIRYFLVAVRETAIGGRESFQNILALRRRAEHDMTTLGRKAGNGRRLLDLLYQQPYVNAGEVAEYLDVTHQTAMSLIRDFMDMGLLEETTGYERNRRFLFREYYDLFASR